MNLDERLNRIVPRLEDPAFLTNSGIGNEIGFYVFDYPAEQELRVREAVELVKKHFAASTKPRVIEVNLLDLLVAILKDRKAYDKVLANEATWSADELKKKLSPIVKKDAVAQRIADAGGDGADIILITGVGAAYPLIRMHEVLNNLHDKLDTKPVVIFYPGKYNMQELVLFGLLDTNYYRAFRLID